MRPNLDMWYAEYGPVIQNAITSSKFPITKPELIHRLRNYDDSLMYLDAKTLDRRIRDAVSRLVRSGVPVAGGTKGNPGYYLLKTKDAKMREVKSLRSRGKLCLERAAKLMNTKVEDEIAELARSVREES